MSFVTEASFQIKDNASQSIKGIINELTSLDAAITGTTTKLGSLDKEFRSLGAGIQWVARELKVLKGELRSPTLGMEKLSVATSALGKTLGTAGSEMGLMSLESMRLAETTRGLNLATNKAQGNLGMMNRELQAIQRSAKGAQSSLSSLSNTKVGHSTGMSPLVHGGSGTNGMGGLTAFGAGLMGSAGGIINTAFVGMLGLDMAKNVMHPTMEYDQEMMGLTAMGTSKAERDAIESTALKMKRDMPGTNRVDNLRQIKESFGITKDLHEALKLAPHLAKMKIAMEGVGNEIPGAHTDSNIFTQAVIKSADMTGKFDTEKILPMMDSMFGGFTQTGGLVNPNQIAQALKFSRMSRYGKNDDWTFGVLPYLLEESALGKKGGGSMGVGPMVTQLDRLAQGAMPKPMIAMWEKMGLFNGGSANAVGTTTLGTIAKSPVVNQDTFIKNPFEWYKSTFKPAMLKAEYPNMAKDAANKKFDQLGEPEKVALFRKYNPGIRQQGGDVFSQFMLVEKQFDKSLAMRHKQMKIEEAYQMAISSTAMKAKTTAQEFYELKLQLGDGLKPAVNSFNQGLSALFAGLGHTSQQLPETAAAIKEMNKELFGAQGSFAKISESLASVDWKSITKVIDSLGAWTINGTMDSMGVKAIGGGFAGQNKAIQQSKARGGDSFTNMVNGLFGFGAGAIEGAFSPNKFRSMTEKPKMATDMLEYAKRKHTARGPVTANNDFLKQALGDKGINVSATVNFNGNIGDMKKSLEGAGVELAKIVTRELTKGFHGLQTVAGGGGAGGNLNQPYLTGSN